MLFLAVRWIASIVVALCLVGAGAIRSQRSATDAGDRTELSPAHVVGKVVPRRDSGLPDQRLGSCVLVDPAQSLFASAPRPSICPGDRVEGQPPAPELHVRSARGPPHRV